MSHLYQIIPKVVTSAFRNTDFKVEHATHCKQCNTKTRTQKSVKTGYCAVCRSERRIK